ncbi:MAG TPA: hypothetical protein VM103_00560 [Candidatus Paceibacterota bacterium]|nr:hypothetical protein [Candidatus Paceibacterota bacterium]
MMNEGIPEPLRPTRRGIEIAYRDAGIKKVEDFYSRDFFVQHYGEASVAADEKEYDNFHDREAYQVDQTEHGAFLETVFGRAHRLGAGFFGEAKIRLLKTYRYDDVFRGVDYVAEFKKPDGSHALFGFDVTTGETQGKVDDLKKRFERGHLSDLKYYVDPDNQANVGIQNMPNFILGVQKQDLEKFLAQVEGAVTPSGQVRGAKQLQKAEADLIAKMQGYFKAQLAEQTQAYWSVLKQGSQGLMTGSVAIDLSRLVEARRYREAHDYLADHKKETNQDESKPVHVFEKFLTIGMMGEKQLN